MLEMLRRLLGIYPAPDPMSRPQSVSVGPSELKRNEAQAQADTLYQTEMDLKKKRALEEQSLVRQVYGR